MLLEEEEEEEKTRGAAYCCGPAPSPLPRPVVRFTWAAEWALPAPVSRKPPIPPH